MSTSQTEVRADALSALAEPYTGCPTGTQCKLCECADGVIHRAREMMFGTRDEFVYFECRACGCLQLVNVPTDISRYYPSRYYSFADTQPCPDLFQSATRRWLGRIKNSGHMFGGNVLSRALCRFRPRPDFDYIRDMLAPTSVCSYRARILDVGCGNGDLLIDLAAAGFDNLVGVDPYVKERRDLGPVTILAKHAEDLDVEPFDLIMCHHTLEHMSDQVAAMRAFHRLLKDMGTCLIRIPIASSEVWRKYRTDWVELDAPRHLFLHSRQSFERLACQSGFEVSHVAYDSTRFAYWGSELYRRNIPLCVPDTHAIQKPEQFFTSTELAAFDRSAEMANERKDGGRAEFYLRKKMKRDLG